MKAEDYKDGIEAICALAKMAEAIPAKDMLEAIDRCESFGFIIDPTLYRNFLFDKKARIDLDTTKKLAEKVREIQFIIAQAREKFLAELSGGGSDLSK